MAAFVELGYDFDAAVRRQTIDLTELQHLRNECADIAPKDVTDKQLALFLDACGSVRYARKCLETYYTVRRTCPEHFAGRDPNAEDIQQCLDNQDYFYIPPGPNGFPIIFHRLSNSKPGNYHFDQAIKTFFMTIDACLHKLGPHNGIIFVFDMKEVRFGHLTRVRLASIKKFFTYLQDGLPGKLCQIHVVNVVSFFDRIISMIKPFMRAEIFKSLYTYTGDIDLDEFHAKWIPKQCLPKELGGDLPTISEMHAKFRDELDEMREYFLAEERQRTAMTSGGAKAQQPQPMVHQFGRLEFD